MGSGPSKVVSGFNTIPVSIGPGAVCDNPGGAYPNEPCVTVEICVPGTSQCQTVSDILLDTGSVGLRLFSQATTLTLPNETTSGLKIGECAYFGSATTWGSVNMADVILGSEAKITIPIQIIDPIFEGQYNSTGQATATNPACGSGTVSYSPQSSEYNGILGIGLFLTDGQSYFSCTGNVCTTASINKTQEVSNPVANLSQDNNGLLLELPSVGASGNNSATGTLILGVDTESNNSSTGLESFTTNSSGDVNGTFNGGNTTDFFDSGSNGLFFEDSSIKNCQGGYSSWYCPSSTINLYPVITGDNGNTKTISFSVENAMNLFSTSDSAFNDLAGSGFSSKVDIGIPYFYGKTIGLVFNTKSSTFGLGPMFLSN